MIPAPMRALGESVLAFTLLFGLAGCRGGGAGQGAEPGLVSVERLPDRHRAVLAAYGEGGEAWEAMRAEVRGDAALVEFTVQNLALELVRAHDALVGSEAGRARRAHDRARAELVRLAPESLPVLVELLAVGDDVVAAQVGEVLALVDEPDAATRVAGLLGEREERSRRRAARLLGELCNAGGVEAQVLSRLVAAVRADSAWSVRAEAARALGLRAARGRDTRGVREVLERALLDSDLAVATCAAEGLGALEDPLAVPALAGALERGVDEGHLRLVGAAQGALVRATGERYERDVAGWRRWWQDHADAVRLRAAGGG